MHSPGDFVSSVFLCAQKNRKYRVILHLKNVNNYAEKICFKMETLQHILHLIECGFWMKHINICDAFLGIPVLPKHQIYLKFEFDREILMYVCLPFGFTGFPRIFTKVLRPVLARTVSFYLDDLWQGDTSFKNLEKSVLVPAQCITIPGTVLDFVNMMVFLPKDKRRQYNSNDSNLFN